MKRMHILLLIIFFLPSLANSQVALTPEPDLLWFKPELVVNSDQICSALYQDAVEKFLAVSPLRASYYRGNNTEPDFLGMQALSLNDPTILSQTGAVPSVNINGKQIFLKSITNNGCGGYCETYQLQASSSSLFESDPSSNLTFPSTYGFQLYRDQMGAYWALVLDGEDRNLLVYKVPEDGIWTTACEVSFKPESLSQVERLDSQPALEAVERLRFRVERLLGNEGNCGTSATLTRWTNSLRRSLPELIYQPWKSAVPSSSDDAPYAQDLANLEDWSLFNTSEYKIFQEYLAELNQSVATLAEFYAEVYGWSPEDSEQLAYAAATTIIGKSIRFYEFGAFTKEERDVRRAILSGMQPEKLKELNFDFGQESSRLYAERIVSLAISSPELLDYIIKAGGDVNSENDFGKTPLMYAAQNNNLEAVRVLLAAGANPNATTRRGPNSCYYNLSTFNMTPLHYAVRYANPELIRLLLDGGAAPYIITEGLGEKSNANALNWLRIYTQLGAPEINPTMPENMIDQVAIWLEPPPPGTLARRGQELVLDAERLYQSGELVSAYHRILLALQIDPNNERAISDLSLIALRNHKIGSALEASQKIIYGEFDARLKANAWFNQGLACEINGEKIFSYNGRRHCSLGSIFSFVKALSLESSEARKNKVLQLFDNHTIPFCLIPDGSEGGIRINFKTGYDPEVNAYTQSTMITVLNSRDQDIQPEFFSWVVRPRQQDERTVTPEKVQEMEFGAQVLSVYRTNEDLRFPHRFGNYICETPDDSDATVVERENNSGFRFISM